MFTFGLMMFPFSNVIVTSSVSVDSLKPIGKTTCGDGCGIIELDVSDSKVNCAGQLTFGLGWNVTLMNEGFICRCTLSPGRASAIRLL